MSIKQGIGKKNCTSEVYMLKVVNYIFFSEWIYDVIFFPAVQIRKMNDQRYVAFRREEEKYWNDEEVNLRCT